MRLPWRKPTEERNDPLTLGEWAAMFSFGGLGYPFVMSQTLQGREETIDPSFRSYIDQVYRSNGPIFACILARMLVFSEARFQFRQIRNGRPGQLYGTEALRLLEKPWTGGTTGDVLARSEQDSSLGGNAFWTRNLQTLHRMRPDWVTIVAGSPNRSEGDRWALDAELLGYLYHPGGPGSGQEPVALMPEHVAHYAPIPDPAFAFRGMSWLDPVIREILGDGAAMDHKWRYFTHGATPSRVVSLDPSIKPDDFERWIRIFEAKNTGVANAYKTMFLGAGATTTVVGSDLKQIDFKVVQGHGETRIAAAAGVPPVIAGFSEGLEAATYANYAQARRRFADGTIRPLWRNFCGSMARIIDVPGGSQLWYDDRDIPFLQEDRKDAAEIQGREAATITALIREGYTPDSVVAAVSNDNWSLLEHTGLISVQLHDKNAPEPVSAPTNGSGDPAGVPAPTGAG